MSVNSSWNDSPPHSNHSSINSSSPDFMSCLFSRQSVFIIRVYCITNILLLLPLCIPILYMGLQRWRQQRSNSTSATSHSDVFTYHLVTMELFGIFGCILCCCGVSLFILGFYFWTYVWYGEMFFHILTCVERYLAVVHPITYLSLRGERGIRIRNISIGCVWLLSFGATSLMTLEDVTAIFNVCLLIFSIIAICFCSISVLCVLIRPKPGEQGKVDQSKLRAFYTIVAILGVLLLRLVWTLIWTILTLSDSTCVIKACGSWFNLPCSLALPLLFLHRAGIFACCKNNTR